ncbi:MAG: malonate decarboxylase holo-[acyl-carrier-protein] synthase [Bacillota bacterium]
MDKEKIVLKRHNFVEITDIGRMMAFEYLKASYADNLEEVEKLIVSGYDSIKIPGIMRRHEGIAVADRIPVGFSSPYLYLGRRLRIPAFIPEKEIIKIISPYDIAGCDFAIRTKPLQALQELLNAAHNMGITVGIWGSAGLEVYTKLPYTHDKSDLDILMAASDYVAIKEFYEVLKCLGSKHNCTIDLELDLPCGYGVKTAELFIQTQHILAKGIFDVKLIEKSQLIESLKTI